MSQILWIFRFVLTHSAQNDNGDFVAVATPYNPLGRFVLTHSAQNDNTLVILNFAEQSEVSTNLKCEFAFLGRGFFAFLQKAQNDKGVLSLQAPNTQKIHARLEFQGFVPRKIPQSLFA